MIKEILLPQRIVDARSNHVDTDFGMYVRLTRKKLKLDRAQLAEESGLQRNTITFLENNLLLPGELTEDVQEKLERTLGISFEAFQYLNRNIMDQLRPDWG